MTESIAPELVAFLSHELGVPPARLRPEARLLQDLGVDGADGWELLREFGHRFGVDVSAFEHGRHFGPETGPSLLTWTHWSLTGSWPRVVPITVGDLEAARRSGHWTTPDRAAI